MVYNGNAKWKCWHRNNWTYLCLNVIVPTGGCEKQLQCCKFNMWHVWQLENSASELKAMALPAVSHIIGNPTSKFAYKDAVCDPSHPRHLFLQATVHLAKQKTGSYSRSYGSTALRLQPQEEGENSWRKIERRYQCHSSNLFIFGVTSADFCCLSTSFFDDFGSWNLSAESPGHYSFRYGLQTTVYIGRGVIIIISCPHLLNVYGPLSKSKDLPTTFSFLDRWHHLRWLKMLWVFFKIKKSFFLTMLWPLRVSSLDFICLSTYQSPKNQTCSPKCININRPL